MVEYTIEMERVLNILNETMQYNSVKGVLRGMLEEATNLLECIVENSRKRRIRECEAESETLKVEEGLIGHVGLQRSPSLRGGRCRVRSILHNRIPPPEHIPLEEAAKRELQAMPTKTPVSMLQELLSRRGTTPKYELVQVEGAIHEPTFRYTVSVGETIGTSRFAAMGTGRSKKEAKHAAAKAILDKITGNTEPSEISSPSSNTENLGPSLGAVEERMVGNPIGLLQELCMTRRWPPPAYETESEEGLPHERLFTISCLVFRHKEIGTGKSKKIAKRLAAHKMWMRLKELPCESNTVQYGLDDDDEISQRLPQSEFDSLKMVKIPTLSTAPYNIKVSQFHKNLKSSCGPKLDELQKISLKDPDFNAVQFLQEVATEQQFEVTFVDVEEKSVTGSSMLQQVVTMGTGWSKQEAKNAAAKEMLNKITGNTKPSDTSCPSSKKDNLGPSLVAVEEGIMSNPISLLQELCLARGWQLPVYKTEKDGLENGRQFTISCLVVMPKAIATSMLQQMVTMGTGWSKQEAKNAAAKEMLHKITGNTKPGDISSPSSNTDNLVNIFGADEEQMLGNPVDFLLQLCFTRRWTPPIYKIEGKEDLDHRKLFTISCRIFRDKEIGQDATTTQSIHESSRKSDTQ